MTLDKDDLYCIAMIVDYIRRGYSPYECTNKIMEAIGCNCGKPYEPGMHGENSCKPPEIKKANGTCKQMNHPQFETCFSCADDQL